MQMLVRIEGLKKYFPIGGLFSFRKTWLRAVDGVSFSICQGEAMGLVGESGSGKSTLGRMLLRLLERSAGEIQFMGQNIFDLEGTELMKFRRNAQMIFQNPYASLNPRKTIRQTLRQPFVTHKVVPNNELESKVSELLEQVGLTPPKGFLDRYPHELSGGQRQRVVVARAIALNPRFIVADEPVSALDLSVRAQILLMLRRLHKEFRLTQLFITHDLAVVNAICDRTAVMYAGKLVELAHGLHGNPLHPYTKALLSAVPYPHPRIRHERDRIILRGEVPSPMDPPKGCRFHPRCPSKMTRCTSEEPCFHEVGNADGHFVACHLFS